MLPYKQQLVANLALPVNDPRFNTTVIYLTYRTIEKNQSLTIWQLKRLMIGKYFLDDRVIDSCLAGLTGSELFNAVRRFQKHGESSPTLEAKAQEKLPKDFLTWLSSAEKDFPELLALDPPIFLKKKKAIAQ